MLSGIMRDGRFIPAEPWSSPATEEQDVENKNRLTERFLGLSEQIEARRRAPDEAVGLLEARQLIDAVRGAGFTITLGAGGKVEVRGAGTLLGGTVERLKANRDAIVRVLESEAAR
jgi:hypothetical protein